MTIFQNVLQRQTLESNLRRYSINRDVITYI